MKAQFCFAEGGRSSAASGVSSTLLTVLFFLNQAKDQKAVMIIAFDRRLLDRAGKLDHFFKSAVSDLELIMRDPFAAGAVATRTADAEHRTIERDLNIPWLNSGQVDLHDPAIAGAVHIGRRTPQASRRSFVTRALYQTKIT